MTEREIFLAALDLSDPAARIRYLDEACSGDPALRAQVESLLLSHDTAGSFLGNPAVSPSVPDVLTTRDFGSAATPDDDANGADNDLAFLDKPGRPDSLGRLGHYEMLQVLGRGAFGIVFRAFDDRLQRVVAIKVMAPQIAILSPARKRFVREARSSAAVRHDNVVQVYEVGEQPLPYLAMEFIPGETLQQKLDRTGPLDVPEVLRIGRQIAEGLAAAHANDLIHRDIKPANVLLEGGAQQRAKITDFGLARAADDASISQSGVIAGTPMFMAPEQALGHQIDQRADLFSFGSVLYQMVSGRPPFRAPSALAVLKRVAEESPRPIHEIIPETPAWLCDIIAKLHAKDPNDRYQSAREVADVLADCEAQLKANAKIKDFSRIPQSKPAAGRSGRWKWVAAAALLLPVLVLAVTEIAGITHLLREQQPNETATPKIDASGLIAKVDPKTPSGDTVAYALRADGLNVVNVPTLKLPATGSLTLEAYVTPRVVLDSHNYVVGGPGQFTLKIWGRAWHSAMGTPDGNYHGIGNVPVVLGERVHVAVVRQGTLYRLYVGGVMVASGDIGGPTKDATLPVIIGASLDGEIAEVCISKVARYDKNFTPAKRFEPDKDTLALYHCDEGSGDVLKDSSGNGHHGQIVGAKWVKADGTPIDPPPAAKAPRHAKQEPLPPTFKNGIGMEFVIVPKGNSWLGGGKDKLGDREVVIPADFYLGKYEVTQEEWEKVMGENPSHFSRKGAGIDAVKDIKDADLKRFPVENVSWDQCQLFLAKLNKLEKETGWVYRLPKEAEWEYACRGGPMSDKLESAFDFYLAKPTNTLLPEQANFNKVLDRTCKVGSYEANRLGLFDMHGNVWEWCEDTENAADGASHRVVRGGCWVHVAGASRAASRYLHPPSTRLEDSGLRLARVPSGAPLPEAKTPPP